MKLDAGGGRVLSAREEIRKKQEIVHVNFIPTLLKWYMLIT